MGEERLFDIDWPSRLGRASKGIYIDLPASPLRRAGVWNFSLRTAHGQRNIEHGIF